MLAAVLFGLFLVVLLLGVPIGFSMGFLTIAAFEVGNGPLITLAQKMYAGINNLYLSGHPPVHLCGRDYEPLRPDHEHR